MTKNLLRLTKISHREWKAPGLNSKFISISSGTLRPIKVARIFLLKGLVLFSLVSGQAHVPFSARMTGGRIEYSNGRYEKAAEQFAFAVADNPKSAEARIWLGMALSHLQRNLEAAAQFDTASQLDSLYFNKMLKNEDCRYQALTSFSLASRELMISSDTNDWKVALNYIKQVLKIEPKSRQALTILAQLYLQLNQLAELRTRALELIRTDSTNPLGYTMLGLYFFNQSDWDSVRVYYLAAAQKYQIQYQQIKEQLANVLTINDTIKLNKITASLIRARRDRNPKRLQTLIEDSLKAKSKLPVLTRIADDLYIIENELNTSYFRAGVASLQRTNQEKTKETQEFYLQQAKTEFEQALSYNPNDLDAKHNLAFIFYRQGGLAADQRAMELYEEIIKAAVVELTDPRLPSDLQDSLYNLITKEVMADKYLQIPPELMVKVENEFYKKGVEITNLEWLYFPKLTANTFDKKNVFLAKLAPQALENLYLLYGSAQANVAMGLKQEKKAVEAQKQFESAIVSFDLVLALNPKNTDAIKSKGVCLSELGRKQEAYELLKRLENLQKEK